MSERGTTISTAASCEPLEGQRHHDAALAEFDVAVPARVI
jgi:hypothetical protein